MNEDVKKISLEITVGKKDLPLYCPSQHSPLWSSHPRVFLPVAEKERVVCPYCGTRYILDSSR